MPCGKVSKATPEPTANKFADIAGMYPHFRAYKGAKHMYPIECPQSSLLSLGMRFAGRRLPRGAFLQTKQADDMLIEFCELARLSSSLDEKLDRPREGITCYVWKRCAEADSVLAEWRLPLYVKEVQLRWLELDYFTGLNPAWVHTMKDYCSPEANNTKRRLNGWLRHPISLCGLAPRQPGHSIVPNQHQ